MLFQINKNKHGFTLIELVVVLIIIGILILLALPRFTNYIEESRYTRIVNDISVVESVSVSELVKNNMKFPEGTDDYETDLSDFANEKRAYMKDGLVAENIIHNFKPDVGRVSEKTLADISQGYYKLEKYKFVKDKTKTKLRGEFYINKRGEIVYIDDKSAKGEIIPKEEFIDRTGLFLYDDRNNEPGTIIGLNFDHKYWEDPNNKADVDYLYSITKENKKSPNPYKDESYYLPQIPDMRITENGKKIPVTKIKRLMKYANRDKVLYGENLVFGDNMKEIEKDAFTSFVYLPSTSTNQSGDYSLIEIVGEINANNIEVVGEKAFLYAKFTDGFNGKNIKIIGDMAFKNSIFTGEFDAGEITKIGKSAFENSKFTGNFNGKNIETIGDLALKNSIFSGDFDGGNLISLGKSAFENSKFTGNFNGNGIKTIGDKALKNSIFTGEFDAGELTIIGSDVFEKSNFKGPFDGKDIKFIGNNTFRNSKFTGEFNGGDISSLGNYAFENSIFTGEFDAKNLTRIGGYTFRKSKFEGEFDAKDLTRIGESAYKDSKFIGEFDPKNLTSIDGYAFENSEFEGEFDVKNLTSIGWKTFKNSKFIGEFDPKNLKWIGQYAFYNSKFTGEFDVKNLTSIGQYAFYNSKFIGEFDPKNLELLEDRAFLNSEFTGSLNTGKLTQIGSFVFTKSNFDSVLLGKSLEKIGTSPFGKINEKVEDNIIGSEEDESGLHSMILPNLRELSRSALSRIKIRGKLDIPKIQNLGYRNIYTGVEEPADFRSCNFTEINTDFLKTQAEKDRFIDAVKNNKYWER